MSYHKFINSLLLEPVQFLTLNTIRLQIFLLGTVSVHHSNPGSSRSFASSPSYRCLGCSLGLISSGFSVCAFSASLSYVICSTWRNHHILLAFIILITAGDFFSSRSLLFVLILPLLVRRTFHHLYELICFLRKITLYAGITDNVTLRAPSVSHRVVPLSRVLCLRNWGMLAVLSL